MCKNNVLPVHKHGEQNLTDRYFLHWWVVAFPIFSETRMWLYIVLKPCFDHRFVWIQGTFAAWSKSSKEFSGTRNSLCFSLSFKTRRAYNLCVLKFSDNMWWTDDFPIPYISSIFFFLLWLRSSLIVSLIMFTNLMPITSHRSLFSCLE